MTRLTRLTRRRVLLVASRSILEQQAQQCRDEAEPDGEGAAASVDHAAPEQGREVQAAPSAATAASCAAAAGRGVHSLRGGTSRDRRGG